jgi:uncharacterized protein DUF4260
MMPSAVSGVPRIVLRTEGMTLLLTAVILYARMDDSWWLFAILFLAPDISFLGYLGGPRIGAIAYNAAHTLVGPLLLATAGMLLPVHILIPLVLIWVGHIGFDRLLGYGLKYEAGFDYTHLGRLRRANGDAPRRDAA